MIYAQKKAFRPEKLLKGKQLTARMSATEQRMSAIILPPTDVLLRIETVSLLIQLFVLQISPTIETEHILTL